MVFSAPRTRFWIALGLSVLFHMGIGGGLVFAPMKPLTRESAKSTVELMSPEEMTAILNAAKNAKSNAQQIVTSDEKRINDEKDEKAKFLSKFDQKVVRETRAMKAGKFTNEAGRGKAASAQPKIAAQPPSSNEPKETKKAAGEKAQIATFENGDFPVAPKTGLQAFNPSFRKLPVVPDPMAVEVSTGDGQEVSATDDHLKNVPTGLQTMLSTREFIYYSYYNRIKDKLRQHWEPKIKEKFERIVRQGRTIASEGDKITKVIIVLDEKGTLIRVQVVSRSGVTDLDDAAVEAFRAAAPFPNPPKGIVEEDGTIKIRWDFVLEA
ncbi:MAG: TonB family protein [Bdellovibrionales bacterium]|nr:TonB family protein [Bdellovibrionales bacterium]